MGKAFAIEMMIIYNKWEFNGELVKVVLKQFTFTKTFRSLKFYLIRKFNKKKCKKITSITEEAYFIH